MRAAALAFAVLAPTIMSWQAAVAQDLDRHQRYRQTPARIFRFTASELPRILRRTSRATPRCAGHKTPRRGAPAHRRRAKPMKNCDICISPNSYRTARGFW